MKRALFTIFLVSIISFGCKTARVDQQIDTISPQQAIQTAAANLDGVNGVFEMQVKNIGSVNGSVFLNSESDYRDQRCLTISISPNAVVQLRTELKVDPQTYFGNRTIRIKGTAKRVRIAFIANGRITDKYYYQTQIRVDNPDQITLIND
jgi:hypothetical protein